MATDSQNAPETNGSSAIATYAGVCEALKSAIGVQRDWLSNLATASKVLAQQLPDLSGSGFFVWKEDRLEIGPFEGKTTDQQIKRGFGILGSVVSLRDPVLVEDIRKLADFADKASVISKVALPLIVGDRLVAILDLDSDSPGRFSVTDVQALREIVDFIVSATDWPERLGSDKSVPSAF